MLQLMIGNKNYSSWSLRPWFFMKVNRVPFREIRLAMFTPGWKDRISEYSPAGRVPVLIDDGISVWDSYAIMEHVAERFPQANTWPRDIEARALARSISAEMHSGFLAIRNELPQNIRAANPLQPEQLSDDCRNQAQRVQQIWTDCRLKHGQDGPWLFGEFSIADAFYAPVVMRFHTYAIPMNDTCAAYAKHVRDCPAMSQWIEDSRNESEYFDFIDNLKPINETPLTPG